MSTFLPAEGEGGRGNRGVEQIQIDRVLPRRITNSQVSGRHACCRSHSCPSSLTMKLQYHANRCPNPSPLSVHTRFLISVLLAGTRSQLYTATLVNPCGSSIRLHCIDFGIFLTDGCANLRLYFITLLIFLTKPLMFGALCTALLSLT